MAAAQAVLDYLKSNDILSHTKEMGEKLKATLKNMQASYPVLGDVRGSGLFIGVDIVEAHTTKPNHPLAVQLIETLREHKVLISLCGPYGNVLKIRPPLVFDDADLDWFTNALQQSLKELS